MRRAKQQRVPLVEWVVGGASLAIVVGTIGYLIFQAIQGGQEAPVLTVSVAAIRESGGAYAVDVEVRNDSPQAAADVHLAGTVRSNDGRELRSEARVDYVPGFSTRRASLIFAAHPGARPDLRVVGYVIP